MGKGVLYCALYLFWIIPFFRFSLLNSQIDTPAKKKETQKVRYIRFPP